MIKEFVINGIVEADSINNENVFTAPPVLRDGEHRVLQARLYSSEVQAKHLEGCLSEDERVRAAQYKSHNDRNCFILARVTLRRVLSNYLDMDPLEIRFEKNKYGKPSVSKEQNPNDIRFNVSYSNELMLIAVSSGLDVGVDIEYMRPEIECIEVAAQFFTSREVAMLCKLPREEVLKNFYRLWTCKEAYVKATGLGLSLPLNRFEVALSSDGVATLKNTDGSIENVSIWSLSELTLACKYKAALVTEKPLKNIKFFQTSLDGLEM